MLLPTRKRLLEIGTSWSYAPNLHPTPRFYKYTWQLFTLQSPLEGEEFLTAGPRLSTAACVEEMARLDAIGQPWIRYGSCQPRRFVGMPFDPESARWKNTIWAPALEDDADPEWEGHR